MRHRHFFAILRAPALFYCESYFMSYKLGVLFLFFTLSSASVMAETEEETQTPWYQIELIIFKYTNEKNTETESWPDDPGAPDMQNALELIPQDALEEYLSLTSPSPLEEQAEHLDSAVNGEINTHATTAVTEPTQTLPTVTSITPLDEANATNDTEPSETITYVDETPFVLLPTEELELSRAREDLEQHSAYEVLHYIAWRQPVFPAGESQGIHIHTDMEDGVLFLERTRQRLAQEVAQMQALAEEENTTADALSSPVLTEELPEETTTMGIDLSSSLTLAEPIADEDETEMSTTPPSTQRPLLEGVVRVSLSRYLHLSTDLTLSRDVTLPVRPLIFHLNDNEEQNNEELIMVRESSDTELAPPSISTQLGDIAFTEITTQKPYRLIESRRMRSKEAHYLDHPALGIVAYITPYERPVVDPQQETPIENIMIGVTP